MTRAPASSRSKNAATRLGRAVLMLAGLVGGLGAAPVARAACNEIQYAISQLLPGSLLDVPYGTAACVVDHASVAADARISVGGLLQIAEFDYDTDTYRPGSLRVGGALDVSGAVENLGQVIVDAGPLHEALVVAPGASWTADWETSRIEIRQGRVTNHGSLALRNLTNGCADGDCTGGAIYSHGELSLGGEMANFANIVVRGEANFGAWLYNAGTMSLEGGGNYRIEGGGFLRPIFSQGPTGSLTVAGGSTLTIGADWENAFTEGGLLILDRGRLNVGWHGSVGFDAVEVVNGGHIEIEGALGTKALTLNAATEIVNRGQLLQDAQSWPPYAMWTVDGTVTNTGTLRLNWVEGAGRIHQTAGETIAGDLVNPARLMLSMVEVDGGSFCVHGRTRAVTVHAAAVLCPGIYPGSTWVVDGDLDFQGATLAIQVVDAGGGHDLLDVRGQASFDGGMVILAFGNGFVPEVGDRWQVLRVVEGQVTGIESLTLTWSGLPDTWWLERELVSDGLWAVARVSAVPEPGPLSLQALGLAVVGLAARRRRC